MNTAKKIMKKKGFIKKEMDRQFPRQQSDFLWKEAEKKLDQYLRQYAYLPEGVHLHTDMFIFPSAAVYLTVKEALGKDTAYSVIDNSAVRNSENIGNKLAKIMNIPGMPDLFMKLWDPLTRKVFGAKNGFQNYFYPKKQGEFRMDIIACPYHRYFTELGCPELTKIFCGNDDRIYGRLPGVEFIRNTTLGRGGERCDFCLRKR